MFYIYKLTDGEQDYYGQTEDTTRRFREHRSTSKCRSKLLEKSKMKFHIIHTVYTKEEADGLEEFYQLNFACVNLGITGRTRAEHYQDYYQKRGSIKYLCECGSIYTNHHKSRHLKSKKHQNYIN